MSVHRPQVLAPEGCAHERYINSNIIINNDDGSGTCSTTIIINNNNITIDIGCGCYTCARVMELAPEPDNRAVVYNPP